MKWATFVPVQLPGREERFLDDACENLGQAVEQCTEQAISAAQEGRIALFGHSSGAILAYETARHLVEHTNYRPAHLIVSGTAGPSLPRADLGLARLPDAEFIGRLADLVGYAHEALNDPEMREILLPALRSDLSITDGYNAVGAAPLPIPVTAIRGKTDTLVSAKDAHLWRSATSAEFRYVEMAGDHMYLAQDWTPLAAQIDDIAEHVIRLESESR